MCRAPRNPGPRSKLGCVGRPWGLSGPRPRGSPKMAPRCGALGSRAGSIPARRHRRKTSPPRPRQLSAQWRGRRTGVLGSRGGGAGGPRGPVRDDAPAAASLSPMRCPAPIPASRPVTCAHPAPTRPRRTPRPALPLPPSPPAALT